MRVKSDCGSLTEMIGQVNVERQFVIYVNTLAANCFRLIM